MDIALKLRFCFPSVPADVWSSLEQVLIDLVQRSANKVLSRQAVQDILLALRKTYQEKEWKEMMKIIFQSCFVLIQKERSPELLLNNVQELLEEFPKFCGFSELSVGCSQIELVLLLKFRNMMKCGIHLFSAAKNKGKLMDIAGLLSGKLVTTGGGSGPAAKRREAIYEKLSGVTKKKIAAVPRQDDVLVSQYVQFRRRSKEPRFVVRSARRLVAKVEPASSPIWGGLMALSIQNPGLMQVDTVMEVVDPRGYDPEDQTITVSPSTSVDSASSDELLDEFVSDWAPSPGAPVSSSPDSAPPAMLLSEPTEDRVNFQTHGSVDPRGYDAEDRAQSVSPSTSVDSENMDELLDEFVSDWAPPVFEPAQVRANLRAQPGSPRLPALPPFDTESSFGDDYFPFSEDDFALGEEDVDHLLSCFTWSSSPAKRDAFPAAQPQWGTLH